MSCNTGNLLQHTFTHWGRVTHICVSKVTIIGSDNGLPPDRHQAIIWTNAGLLLIGPLGTDFSEILIEILTFSFKKMHLKVSSAKRRPFCLGLNVLKTICGLISGVSNVNITLDWISKKQFDGKVNIGSGNGMALSGKQSLPEPVFTKISDIVWYHKATIT